MRGSGDQIHLSIDGSGVIVEHSIVTLDGDSANSINFLSSVAPTYYKNKICGKQLLTSEDAYHILTARFPKASFLPCQYFRPIALGNIQVEILPSGESPGSGFLRIEKKNDSLFYAGRWSKKKSPAFRKAEFKTSSTLLLHLYTDPACISPSFHTKKETERLIEFCQKIIATGENVIMVSDAFGETLNLASRLAEAGIPLKADAKVNQITKSMQNLNNPANGQLWTRSLMVYGANNRAPSVILISKQHFIQQRPRSVPTGIWIWIGRDVELQSRIPWLTNISFADSFCIQGEPDLNEILELINEVKPSEVLIFGDGAANSIHHLARQGIASKFFLPAKVETLF